MMSWYAVRCFHDPEGVICHSLGPTLPLLIDVAVALPAYKPGMTQPYVAFLHPSGPTVDCSRAPPLISGAGSNEYNHVVLYLIWIIIIFFFRA
jgi:hypothetical protein